MTTPIRQQFRPEDFADAQSAASKVDYSFQQVRTQLNTLGARQVVTLDFINNPANFPFNMPRLRLDNVAGFAVLACVNKGTPSVPQNTPEQVARARLNPRIRVIDLADFSCMCRALDPYKYVRACALSERNTRTHARVYSCVQLF